MEGVATRKKVLETNRGDGTDGASLHSLRLLGEQWQDAKVLKPPSPSPESSSIRNPTGSRFSPPILPRGTTAAQASEHRVPNFPTSSRTHLESQKRAIGWRGCAVLGAFLALLLALNLSTPKPQMAKRPHSQGPPSLGRPRSGGLAFFYLSARVEARKPILVLAGPGRWFRNSPCFFLSFPLFVVLDVPYRLFCRRVTRFLPKSAAIRETPLRPQLGKDPTVAAFAPPAVPSVPDLENALLSPRWRLDGSQTSALGG
jgi:hypothetical protein